MSYLQEEGAFKVKPYSRELAYPRDETSESVGLRIQFKTLARYDQERRDWMPCDMLDVEGTFYIIKRNGEPNDMQVEALMQALGWDGKAASLEDDSIQFPECVIMVKRDEYNGKVRYKADRIHRPNWAPGGRVSSSSDISRLQARLDRKPLPPEEPPTIDPPLNSEIPF